MLAAIESIPTRIGQKLRKMRQELPEPDPGFFAGMELRPSRFSNEQFAEVERALGNKLPDEFRDVVLAYDLGGLELGGVIFGDEGELSDFLVRQIHKPEAVWGPSGRPHDLLFLGRSDGYLILLDTSSGKVYGSLRDEGVDARRVVASDFAKFFRGLATLFLEEVVSNDEAFARQLATETGSGPDAEFWLHRVKGFA